MIHRFKHQPRDIRRRKVLRSSLCNFSVLVKTFLILRHAIIIIIIIIYNQEVVWSVKHGLQRTA